MLIPAILLAASACFLYVLLQEEAQLIKPAVFGTENVLNAVNAAGTVRRVVLTASTAAVFTDAFERGEGHVFTEKDWNISATPTKFPYFYSKRLAEQVSSWYLLLQQSRTRAEGTHIDGNSDTLMTILIALRTFIQRCRKQCCLLPGCNSEPRAADKQQQGHWPARGCGCTCG